MYHCQLLFEAEVGKRVQLDHYRLGVEIHLQTTIGDRVRIYHGVKIAGETWIGSPYRVTIGSNAQMSVGCAIIARANTNLSIGEGAIIGANAVVTRGVPAGEIWAGGPARRIGGAVERRRRLGLPNPADCAPFQTERVVEE